LLPDARSNRTGSNTPLSNNNNRANLNGWALGGGGLRWKGKGGWLKEEFSKLVNLAATMESQIHVHICEREQVCSWCPDRLGIVLKCSGSA